MQIRLSVLDRATGTAADLLVRAGTGTSYAQVAESLAAAVQRQDGPAAHVGGQRLAGGETLGMPPLVQGAVVELGVAPRPPAVGLHEVHVVAGPDAGHVYQLGPGRHVLGRSPQCRVVLGDPDASRRHAELHVDARLVTVRDLGSTNGTSLGAEPATGTPTPWPPAELLRVGTSLLALARPQPGDAATRCVGDGTIELNRPPRVRRTRTTAVVTIPGPPTHAPAPTLSVLAVAVPAALGLVLAFVLGPLYAVFLLLSPLMLLGTWLSERRTAQRARHSAGAEHRAALLSAHEELARAVRADVLHRRAEAPDPARLLLTATGPRSDLWARRRGAEDFLALRLGTADLPARVRVEGPSASPATARQVPVVVRLPEVQVLGLAGPAAQVGALARHVVAALAVLHSPRDVEVVVLAPGRGRAWGWASWLPHAGDPDGARPRVAVTPEQVLAQVTELVRRLDAQQAGPGMPGVITPARTTVLVLDRACGLRELPGVARLLDQGPAAGILAVCVEELGVALPAECGATALLDGGPGAPLLRLEVAGQGPVAPVVADLVRPDWAEQVARALAPLRDATPGEASVDLPVGARLVDLLPFDATSSGDLAAHWSAGARSTRAVLGHDARGVWGLDLADDGPHALVAGTTGSGKSELLQAMVASLAVANRPDELTFVLVDYKGGSAFAECARLPHTAGMVTDLDGAETERALASLGAELTRRERIFAAHGATDITAYHSLTGAPPLPRLILVVDEFAALAEEAPDFLGGLVGVAQRGRSLGLHLVLATQRPSGVISADIRANTSLRIALRTSDTGESLDVVERPDAATIPRSRPGRAVVRTGAGESRMVQVARVAGRPPSRRAAAVTVQVIGGEGPGPEPVHADGDDPMPSDLARIVAACRDAAQSLGLPAALGPWLPPLPELLELDALPPPSRTGLPFALSDLPGEQARRVEQVRLGPGRHWLLAGGPASGRSTAVLTIGAQAARLGHRQVHLYVLDGASGATASLAALPGCGAVVRRDEPARAARLVARLLAEVARRRELLAASPTVPAAGPLPAPGPDVMGLPAMLLLVDGWEGVCAAVEPIEHGRVVDDLLRLLREGPAVGLRAVVTGERTCLTGRVSSLLGDRLLLRFADPGDVALGGLSPRSVPARLPPGRGLLAEQAILTQVAVAPPVPVARRSEPGEGDDPGAPRPLRVDALPARVSASEVLARHGAPPGGQGPWWTLIGVGGDELRPLGVDLEHDGPALVIAGPPGSGRSTALLTAATHLGTAGRPLVVVAPQASPLRALEGRSGVRAVLSPEDAASLRTLLQGQSSLVVVLDDVEQVLGGEVDDLLCSVLRPGAPVLGGAQPQPPRVRHRLLLAGDASALAGAFRGIAVEARRARTGLALCPAGGLEADLFGVRLARDDDRRPGRGVLVLRGRPHPVQVATPAQISQPAPGPAGTLDPHGRCGLAPAGT